MDKVQRKVLEQEGYVIDGTEGVRGIHRSPRMTFYGFEKRDGVITDNIVRMPNLPADPTNLRLYLRKGYVLDPKDLKPQTVASAQEDLICEVCGAGPFKSRIGLVGHKRKHK